MKKRFIVIQVVILALLQPVLPQKVLDLEECYRMAMETNALSKEKETFSEIWRLKDENLAKSWLPALDANASFVYNSEVIDMSGAFASIPIPGFADAIKPLPHEQYKVTIDVSQVLYDGGATKGAREMEMADLSVNQQQAEADLYKLKGQVNGYYFSILIIDKQKELLDSYLGLINRRIKSMSSALDNGVILKSDIDVLNSEMIKLEQQIEENIIRRASMIKNLSDLTGIEINGETSFVVPSVKGDPSEELNRPELKLFDLKKEQLDAGMNMLNSKRLPKAFGFATIGYGNPPGSNFFRDEFAPYYIIGAGIKWNIIDWNKSRNEKQQLMLQKNIVENRKADLSESLRRMLESKDAEIKSLELMIGKDNTLIELRKRISATAESQYENGTITATEYLNELNSEKQALINYEIHKISLEMARVEYLNISGENLYPGTTGESIGVNQKPVE